MKFYNFFEKRTGATLPCIKCRTNMNESETVTSKFLFYINFPKFWYITLLVTTFLTIFQNTSAISWTIRLNIISYYS